MLLNEAVWDLAEKYGKVEPGDRPSEAVAGPIADRPGEADGGVDRDTAGRTENPARPPFERWPGEVG